MAKGRITTRAEDEDRWRERVEELLRIIAKRKRRSHEHEWHLAHWFVAHPHNRGVAYWICYCGEFRQVAYIVEESAEAEPPA